jgi:aminoglycoside-2''-adenylyltransferase
VSNEEQLAAVATLDELLGRDALDYWLFGGWALDFHAGEVTRAHDDDIAVWAADLGRVSTVLERDGWRHTPDGGEDGYTAFEREGARLEVAFLARGHHGEVFTPLRSGARGEWPDDTFANDVKELDGVHARVIGLPALKADKSETRSNAVVAAKDSADVSTLSRLVH